MSQTHANPSSSNFQVVLNAALEAYEEKTKGKLVTHPLAAKLQSCDSLTDIITVFEDLVQQFDHRRKNDQSLTKWLNPTVKILYALSKPLGHVAGLVSLTRLSSLKPRSDCRHSSGILTCADGLLRYRHPSFGEHHRRSLSAGYHDAEISQAAKNVDASQDALIDIFERIGNFIKRLELYMEGPPTNAMTDMIVKIFIELLSILAIATVEIKQSRPSESIDIYLPLLTYFLQKKYSTSYWAGRILKIN